MKILHYFLGFPPYRSGGLTKYATDLMLAQSLKGDLVMALWPGQMKIINKKMDIKPQKKYENIENYELINPLPISLDEGIKNVKLYMAQGNEKKYIDFLSKTNPDIIHIHTLMGIHKEFFLAAKKMRIRIIFTAHDCFPTCTKVTRFRFGKPCDYKDCSMCVQCNISALSLSKIYVMQSPLYRNLKSIPIIKLLRKKHRKNFFAMGEESELPSWSNTKELIKDYEILREFYIEILNKMDFIHYNSSLTKEIYNYFISPKNSNIVTITHKDIRDRRKVRIIQKHPKLRIGFLAPATPYKGFSVLKKALDYIWDNKLMDFELRVYSPVVEPAPYMKIQAEGYKYNQLEYILADTDVVLAPSICYETFGFTVLEALSNGVPVIVSKNVGAKDIVKDGGIIVNTDSVEDLIDAILSLDYEMLKKLDCNIKRNVEIKTWNQFIDENYVMYCS